MLINLIDVKTNNTYIYRAIVPPTTAEKTPAYANGETWIDTVTGLSYKLTDAIAGTWAADELATDSIINTNGDNIFLSILTDINNKFFVERNKAYSDLDCGFPSYTNFDRSKAFILAHTESLFSSWSIDSATKTLTAAGIYGDISAFSAGDMVYISGRKNTGFFTIASVGADSITVNETLKDETAIGFIFLVIIPAEFTQLVGRLIWYDVYIAPTLSAGKKAESIGTYSYTLQDIKNGYPADIAKGLYNYSLISIGGESYYVY